MTDYSIDIVVPTFRLNETILLGIIGLAVPAGLSVAFYIVADNPRAEVPESIQQLQADGKIHLLVNEKNLGAAGTRNAGIRAGVGKWILLLDDDITPGNDLLFVYADAIRKQPDAIGFAGITIFPPPFNAVTKALVINGSVSSFTAAERKTSQPWVPTANVVLNRHKVDNKLFNEHLVNSEDVDFLTRNSLLFKEQYLSVPAAIVFHPWWNDGKIQTRRQMSYGAGDSQIARNEPIKQYTFRDFTNTSETILLLCLAFLPDLFTGSLHIFFSLLIALLLAELLTCWIKGIVIGKTWSLPVAFHIMWAKNCYEFSFLYKSLADGYINGFALRIEKGFKKPFPSPFRTNRWKIIKMILLAILFMAGIIAF